MQEFFPTSNHAQISYIVEIILQVRPQRILDVGAGGGKYGLLAREYLMGLGKKNIGPLRIDAVEGYAPYVSPVYQAVYDTVFREDIRVLAERLESYDLVMMIDMFEHISKEDGAKLLAQLKPKTRSVLISVPAQEHYQEAYDGNDLQVHHAQYTDWHELRKLGFTQVWRIGGNWIALMSPVQVSLRSRIFRTAASALLPLGIARAVAPIFSKLRKMMGGS